jgi:hypothetical protein
VDAIPDRDQLDLRCALDPSETAFVPPLAFGEIEDVPHDFEPRIDRPCLHLVLLALRDERLKSAHVHLLQHEIPDEGIQLPQQAGIVGDALLVLVLFQILRGSNPKLSIRPGSEDMRFANCVYPRREVFLGLVEIARCSAFSNAYSSEHFVDVPDPTSLGET